MEFRRVLFRSGPDAITAGARQIDQTPAALRNPGSEEPFRPNPLWDVNNPNGEPAGLPVLETWDGAKRYLDDLEFDTNSPFIARPQGMTSDTRAIDLTRRQLLNQLDQPVPQYTAARKAFEGTTKAKTAFKLGMEDLLGSRRNPAAEPSDRTTTSPKT